MKFNLSPKKSAQPKDLSRSPEQEPADTVLPELVPIVTLLSAQTHRRYHEGLFMLYYDLNTDGKPGDRQWKEVYGILTGNQLAYWDAASLAKFKDLPDKLLETSTKPNYLNFTDAVFNAMTVLPAAKQQLENVIIVLTTLKNRYIIQFKSYDSLKEWFLCLRLANWEYLSLQEAYTGALLSARGLRLSDIRTILAEKRFNHEDWVKIRYGSGMAWKRCYAVIEPSQLKKKTFVPGRVLLYESETAKKKQLLAVITTATLVTAVYPQLPFFIDKSTIMKLEGAINFKLPSVKHGKKNDLDSQETSLFIMPEAHSSVPGFDTLIRFLIPLYDSFGLYGRPKRLKADRIDPESLVFGLPTLPHVHYLNSSDLYPLTDGQQFLSWDASQWSLNLKRILLAKMNQGYDGCGSSRGFSGAVSSLSSPRLGSPASSRKPSSPASLQQQQALRLASGPIPPLSEPLKPDNNQRAVSLGAPRTTQQQRGQYPTNGPAGAAPPATNLRNAPVATLSNKNVNNLAIKTSPDSRNSVQLADIYQKYSTIETPSDRFNDRNKMLNGSAEEFDEEVLPSLIRKKSLMHGPYPTTEKHLLQSESESEDDDDDASVNGSLDSIQEEPKGALLNVPSSYGNRNSSYSSVQSPLTQYNEFNKQFSKTVDHGPSRLNYRSDEESDEESSGSEFSDDQSQPPAPPAHGTGQAAQSASQPRQYAQQLPKIQQLQLLHSQTHHNPQSPTPSLGTFTDQPSYHQPQQAYPHAPQASLFQQNASGNVPKLRATTNLTLGLKSPIDTQKPRFIHSPNTSQNHLPREALPAEPAHRKPPPGSQQEAKEASPTIAPTSAFRVPPPQQPKQYQQPPQQYYQQHPQQRQQPYPQQPQTPQYSQPPPQPYPSQSSPQQYQQRPPQSSQQPQQHRPPPQQSQQQRPPQSSQQPRQRPQGQAPPQQYAAPQSSLHHRPAPQGQAPGNAPGQHRGQHPYLQRAGVPEAAPSPLQQEAIRHNNAIPPRPQAQQLQSALNIRSYGDQQYQYQVQQPGATRQQPRPQQPQQPQQYPQQQYQQYQQRPDGYQQQPQEYTRRY